MMPVTGPEPHPVMASQYTNHLATIALHYLINIIQPFLPYYIIISAAFVLSFFVSSIVLYILNLFFLGTSSCQLLFFCICLCQYSLNPFSFGISSFLLMFLCIFLHYLIHMKTVFLWYIIISAVSFVCVCFSHFVVHIVKPFLPWHFIVSVVLSMYVSFPVIYIL